MGAKPPEPVIYLDHAATSWPKPPEVLQAMTDFLERSAGNPGRSGHRLSLEAARCVYATREAIAELFHCSDPLRVTFTHNATYALNMALLGILRRGDHVVTSSMEHNAVMRPLRALQSEGVELTVVPCASDGTLEHDRLHRALRPNTRLVVMTGASNVVGTLLPVAEVARAAHTVGAFFLLDAAQTAGVVPLNMGQQGIDLLAFTGHKGLQGPPGTGGLVIGQEMDPTQLLPIIRGGTGSNSAFEEQPGALPDKLESGTLNSVGLAGLGASVRYVLERGLERIRAHEMELSGMLHAGLSAIAGVTVYGPADPATRAAIVSFAIAGRRVSEIGQRLDEDYGILCRVGLHCAPAAHRSLGTFPEGTVRLSLGPLTTHEEIERALCAVEEIART
jgi:cysteine desulfurase / selenocysteine lyase